VRSAGEQKGDLLVREQETKNGHMTNRENEGEIRRKATHLQITAMTKASANPVPIIIVTLFLQRKMNRELS
jgi:hypothetical protein